jgi:hypothetical protein
MIISKGGKPMLNTIKKHIAVIMTVMMTILMIPVISFAADTADDIKYSISGGKELSLDEDDFYDGCDDATGGELNWVKFDLPSSSKGVLYYDYKGSDEEEIDDGTKYYYDDEPNIGDVSFVPEDDYSGTVTIAYTGRDTDSNSFTGDIVIKVGSSDDADAITYSGDNDDTLDFNEDDFNDVCQDLNDEDLDFVNFTLPSSTKGILYYDYDGSDEAKVSKSTEYYYSDDPSIDDITFVPNDDYSGTAVISYAATDEDGDDYSGTVKITISDSGSSKGDINYSTDADEDLSFDEDDFNDFCEDENDEKLDYVKFTLPSSSKGVLYFDYDGDDEAKISTSTKYYYDDDPSIDDITFVPDEDFGGTCKISFEGYDTEGDSIDGTVAIVVSNEDLVADTIYLSGIAGLPITMYDQYFNKNCKELFDTTLDYVKFTLPSASSGTLYYNYTSAGNYTSLVSASTKYYYDDDSPYLSKVAFVSAGTGAGTYPVKYTGYDTEGSSFTGTLNFTVTAKTSSSSSGASSNYFSDVNGDYSWAVSYIDTLYSTAVVAGETAADGTRHFSPSSKITRADFMLLLCRALNLSSSGSGNFSDVAAGSYYYDAMATAKALGIAQGTDNRFYPTATITREDAMVLAQRAMNISGNSAGTGNISDLASYYDNASVSSYAKEAIAALIKAGIVTGNSDGQLHPKDSITRAEAAAIIYRIKY